MKAPINKPALLFIFLLLVSNSIWGQVELQSSGNKEELATLLNFNFLDNKNSWSNLTPGAFYGWNESLQIRKKIGWQFSAGPYVSSQISIKDSSSFLPGLMTPGNAGLMINEYFTLGATNHKFIISPMNLGLKVLSNFSDSSSTLIQHNVRLAIGYQFKSMIIFSVQYTLGWHNLISSGEENFEKIFNKKDTGVKYLNATIQTKVSKDSSNPLYLIITWRNFLDYRNLGSLPNRKILSIGVIKNLNFSNSAPATVRN